MNKEMEKMTVEQAAKKLGVSTARIGQYIANGALPASKFGRQWVIDPKVLDSFTRRPRGRPPKGTSKRVKP